MAAASLGARFPERRRADIADGGGPGDEFLIPQPGDLGAVEIDASAPVEIAGPFEMDGERAGGGEDGFLERRFSEGLGIGGAAGGGVDVSRLDDQGGVVGNQLGKLGGEPCGLGAVPD